MQAAHTDLLTGVFAGSICGYWPKQGIVHSLCFAHSNPPMPNASQIFLLLKLPAVEKNGIYTEEQNSTQQKLGEPFNAVTDFFERKLLLQPSLKFLSSCCRNRNVMPLDWICKNWIC